MLCSFAVAWPNWLAVGPAGVLFGTAIGGTSSSGAQTYGSVWSLTPPTAPGGAWIENTLYTITDASVGTPNQILGIGPDGTIYVSGTTRCGNTYCGILFSLTPPTAPTGEWTETTLHNFTGGNDGSSVAAAAVSSNGVLYGTTPDGGTGQKGSVFSLSLAAPLPSINPGGLVNAASYTAPVAPGSIASVFGDFFVPAPLSATEPPLPASLAGLSIIFDASIPAPLFYVSGSQINFQVPWELATPLGADIAATLYGDTGPPQTMDLAPVAPAIFTVNGSGSGQGAILDASNRLVDASNPATPGSTVLQIFCTGLGPVTNQPPTGSPAPLSPLAQTSYSPPPAVMVGGVAADVSFSGLAPGYVGLYQINAQVPAGLPANSATPVSISYGQGAASSNVVTIAVQ